MSENSENRFWSVHSYIIKHQPEVKTQLYPVFLRQRGYTSTNMLFTAEHNQFLRVTWTLLEERNIIFKVLSWRMLPFMHEGNFY